MQIVRGGAKQSFPYPVNSERDKREKVNCDHFLTLYFELIISPLLLSRKNNLVHFLVLLGATSLYLSPSLHHCITASCILQ